MPRAACPRRRPWSPHREPDRRRQGRQARERQRADIGQRVAAGDGPAVQPGQQHDDHDADAPLRQHRQGIELLHAALAGADTPYRLLLDAVTAVLPELTDADRAAVAALAVDGPPVETVGLVIDGVLAPDDVEGATAEAHRWMAEEGGTKGRYPDS